MSEPAFLPYGRQDVNEHDVDAVVAVLRSDFLTTGPAVEAFEEAISAVSGGHAVVAVNSGTAALHCAYAAAGVGPGSEVVVPPLTFAATATAAAVLGAEVRFCDVEEDTLLLDPDALASVITSRTRVVAPVDFAGQPARLAEIAAVARRVGAVVIEDAAHAIGGLDRGLPVGDLAPMTTYSFHPVKTVTTGEGGAIVVRDVTFLDAVRRFRNHGLVRDPERLQWPDEGPWHQEVQSFGLNYRMPDILAALGTSQLTRLPEFVAARAALVDRYRTLLGDLDGLRLLHQREGTAPGWHLFPIRVLGGRRREVVERLRAAGIGVQVHYLPVHLHPVWRERGFTRGQFPVAEAAYDELVSLPLFPAMTTSDQDRVVTELRRILDSPA